MNQKIKNMSLQLKHELDEPRFDHTMGVMYTAASLAMCYGTDIEDAMIAGLLHDCAKCIPSAEKIRLCEENNIFISEIERKNPSLLHAKLGAYIAATKYGTEDEDILSAITWHTTGKPEMSMLDKIIYIADYMEPGRKDLPNMADVRYLAYKNIDDCLYRILKDSLVYLESRDMPIDPMTRETYEYYKKL